MKSQHTITLPDGETLDFVRITSIDPQTNHIMGIEYQDVYGLGVKAKTLSRFISAMSGVGIMGDICNE